MLCLIEEGFFLPLFSLISPFLGVQGVGMSLFRFYSLTSSGNIRLSIKSHV